jgi:putative mRNA 3-end processing factor
MDTPGEQSPVPDPDHQDLIVPTDRGLWCQAGGFHIDPWKPVDLAVVTHAHADHATPGCKHYIASPNTIALMRSRMPGEIPAATPAFGERFTMGATTVSLHPAGHVLGSSQIRVEPVDGPTWVITGDYKVEPDPTCEPFEPVPCDTLLTECTFGLPIYRWPDSAGVFADINAWWRANAAAGRTTVLLTYALGKAQRVLAGLDASIGPIGLHGALHGPTRVYREAGIALPEFISANATNAPLLKGGGLIVAPPSASATPWIRKFKGPDGLRTAFVSGWMRVRGRRRWGSVDRGFVLSDHADWDGLLDTVRRTGATRVGVTHGNSEPLARYLRETMGIDSFVVPTRYQGESDDAAGGSVAADVGEDA